MLIRWKAADREHHMVPGRRRVRPARAVHATDVARDRVAQRSQQFGEGAVEVEAVAASAMQRDPCHGFDRIDTPLLAGLDPQRLVRDPLDLATMQALQRLDRRRLGVEPEASKIRVTQLGVDGAR
jgi:hypothetical protein